MYLAHRLVWLYVHGDFPVAQIDHKDGDPANNRLSNLRESDQRQNMWNMKAKRTNRTGAKGVHAHAQTGKFRAEITTSGARRSLGLFSTVEEASRAYVSEAERSQGAFAITQSRK